MILNRGNIVMTRLPHAGGNRGKKRPAVIIQADVYNAKLKHYIVAEVTTNLGAASDPASFFIDIATPEGRATGLDSNSVVCCLFLSTVAEVRITRLVGKLSNVMKTQLDSCLKTAIQLW
ncbi:MAG TPA: type II toxin-antitoxin system PemK/MazF family toxin [Planctomycetaceae bacterium]|jgi:mRNA interferase MazF|nr:type II toxin-antitoxin system PemK/MazF family toxin [Planctomycetaceae bacterium]